MQDEGQQARASKILEETYHLNSTADRQGDSQYNTMGLGTTTTTSDSTGSDTCNRGNELTTRQQKIVKQHETQIKSIAEQGAQKLEKLEKVYRAEYTRIKNAQRTLIDEADGIKKAVLANSDDIPEAILREATISVPNGNTEALTTCTNPFDVK